MGWDPADRDENGVAVMERPAVEKHEDARVVVDLNTRDLIEQMRIWAKHDPDLFLKKVKLMKQTAGLGHLTDEQAALEVNELCRKLAQADTEMVWQKRGLASGPKGAVLLG